MQKISKCNAKCKLEKIFDVSYTVCVEVRTKKRGVKTIYYACQTVDTGRIGFMYTLMRRGGHD